MEYLPQSYSSANLEDYHIDVKFSPSQPFDLIAHKVNGLGFLKCFENILATKDLTATLHGTFIVGQSPDEVRLSFIMTGTPIPPQLWTNGQQPNPNPPIPTLFDSMTWTKQQERMKIQVNQQTKIFAILKDMVTADTWARFELIHDDPTLTFHNKLNNIRDVIRNEFLDVKNDALTQLRVQWTLLPLITDQQQFYHVYKQMERLQGALRNLQSTIYTTDFEFTTKLHSLLAHNDFITAINAFDKSTKTGAPLTKSALYQAIKDCHITRPTISKAFYDINHVQHPASSSFASSSTSSSAFLTSIASPLTQAPALNSSAASSAIIQTLHDLRGHPSAVKDYVSSLAIAQASHAADQEYRGRNYERRSYQQSGQDRRKSTTERSRSRDKKPSPSPGSESSGRSYTTKNGTRYHRRPDRSNTSTSSANKSSSKKTSSSGSLN